MQAKLLHDVLGLIKAEGALIASATVEDGKLIVWSCEPRRYAVAASEIPARAKMTPSALTDFEVSESGSRIHASMMACPGLLQGHLCVVAQLFRRAGVKKIDIGEHSC